MQCKNRVYIPLQALMYFCRVAGIYIHIPFCKKACHYCDFHFSTSLRYKEELLHALVQEIGLRKSYLKNETVETIYFGGGTPSLLSGNELNRLTHAVYSQFDVAADAEITLEANPDDLSTAYFKQLKKTGINRLSIGVQSFYDEDLQWMNRAHTAANALSSLENARDFGFNNISIDLIYGFEKLSPDKWQHNIQTALDFQIPHLSAYSMTVEPKTALAKAIEKGKEPLPDDSLSSGQFMLLTETLEKNGYEHYEISNFCLPGRQSRHNTSYWKFIPYLGIGPSAHSYNRASRQWNVSNNHQYRQSIFSDELPCKMEVLSDRDRQNEYVMTGLRTMWGIDLRQLYITTDMLFLSIKNFESKGWIIRHENQISLTSTGKLYADHIASSLFV